MLYILVSFFLILSLGMIITGFFFFHIDLMGRNKTTIEFCEKKEKVD